MAVVLGVAWLSACLTSCTSGTTNTAGSRREGSAGRAGTSASSSTSVSTGATGSRAATATWSLDTSSAWQRAPEMPFGMPKQVWAIDVHEPIDDAHVLGNRLFYVTRTGTATFDVVARSLIDGHPLWRRALAGTIREGTRQFPPSEGDDGGEPVFLDDDSFLVVDTDDQYIGLDPRNGHELWHLDDGDTPWLSLVGRGRHACLGYSAIGADGNSRYHCIGLDDGKEVWSAQGYVASMSERVAYLQQDAGIEAVDASNGHVLWTVLGADGSILEVDGTTVICDAHSVYGVDRDGFRQWDLVATSPSCYRGPRDSVLVAEAHKVRQVRAADGRTSGRSLRIDKAIYPHALVDDRYVVSTGLDAATILDLRSGAARPFHPSVDAFPAGPGVVQVENSGTWHEKGPGSWSIAGRRASGGSWLAPVGWTHPGLLPTRRGLLVVDLGHAGSLWFGSTHGNGPTLAAVGVQFAREQHPPRGRALDGSSVLGVPFGTPFEQARRELTTLLGPPSLRNDHVGMDDLPAQRIVWGTLVVDFDRVGGIARVTGWSDWGVGWSSGWAAPGGVTAWSTQSQLAAAGYTPARRQAAPGERQDLCRDGVCFAYWYGTNDATVASEVVAPPPTIG